MYRWQQTYFKAVLEDDDSRMPHRLLEALTAMEQRLSRPIDEQSDEYKALQETWVEVRTLLTELRDVRPR
jgi:7,8-dihydro-6-hydroxymethylpterin-pyrophosphokinase